jgi:hypothetical protein
MEIFMSHPWTEKRLHRLGVGLDIAEESPSTPTYAIDSISSPDRPVAVLLQGLATFARFLLVRIWVAAFVAGACAWLLPAAAAGLVFVAAVAIAFFSISSLWTRRLKQLAGKVRGSAVNLHGCDWPEAPLCGMSPGLGRTIFDSGYDWDMGLLRLSDDGLCYAGDRAAFALPRTAIDRIELRPGPPVRWKRGQVISVRLRSANPEFLTFKVSLNFADAVSSSRQQELFESMRRWHAGENAGSQPACGLPPIDAASWPKSSGTRRRIVSVRHFLRYLLLAVIPTVLAVWIVWGRSFTPQAIVPPAVAAALMSLLLGRGVLLQEDYAGGR